MAEKKRGLGAKGLGINALINTEVQDLKTAKSNETVTELDLDLIEPNRKQPRKYFDETALEELAASLKAYGMIQPIVVKKNGEYYEIIAGERRWRAAKNRAALGRANALAGPLKNFEAKVCFHLMQNAAEVGLADEQIFRSLGNGAGSFYFNQILQMLRIHSISPII